MHHGWCENFRRWVISSPPWVIFAISLAIMASGILVLAFTLNGDSEYYTQPSSSTAQFCIQDSNLALEKSKLENSSIFENATTVAVPVFVSVNSAFYYEIMNKSVGVGSRTRWTGNFHDGQLGLKASEVNGSMPFETQLESATVHSCFNEICDIMLLQACALVHNVAEAHQKAYSTLEGDTEGQSCNRGKGSAVASGQILRNHFDESTEFGKQWCQENSIVNVQRRDAHGFVLIPLLHDTMTARLHLLYTSYFLFTTILILVVYAMCRKTSHAKPSGRSLDSPTPRYAKLDNERE